jgi:hypothetical protein
MNALIIIVLLAMAGLWIASIKSGGKLKIPLFVLALLALALVAVKLFNSGGGAGLPADIAAIEKDAGYELGEELQAVGEGRVLVLIWEGGGFNPTRARLDGLKESLGKSHVLLVGGPYVEGMKVASGFVKFDPLNIAADLRKYISENPDLAAVVALRPLMRWDGLEGLDAPPFFIFAGTSAWKPFMESGLVKAAMVGSLRERDADEEQPSDFSTPEYKLVRGL